MAVTIKPDGSFEVEYVGPYGGLNVQMPANLIPDSQSPALGDVILRNAEIRSRPNLNASFIAAPSTGVTIMATGVFQGTLWCVGFDGATGKLFTFNFNTSVWTSQGTLPNIRGISQVNWRIFQGKLYLVAGFSASGTTSVSTWDGTTFTANLITIGANNVGAQFIDELDNHLILALTVEGATTFGQRVRWSASGLPAVWDPTVNINAGLADFLEVPDSITGLMMLGRVGYIFRSDGITEVAPTGQGQAPFDFNHLWASQFGIGNVKYGSIAQYGTSGFFVGRDNIYMIQAFQITPIGGVTRDAIMADVGQSGQAGSQQVWGTVIPYLSSTILPDGSITAGTISTTSSVVTTGALASFPYFAYVLCVPKVSSNPGTGFNQLPTSTSVWVYSIEDGSWTHFTFPNFQVTSRPTIAIRTDSTSGTSQPVVLIPGVTTQSSIAPANALAVLDANNFNDPYQGSSYTYKVEDIISNRVPTVRRVILTYLDLGVATITVTITGTDDNATVQSASATVTIGNTVPTNVLMTKFVDLELTAFRPQLSWSRAANGGPVSIVKAVYVGTVERDTTF